MADNPRDMKKKYKAAGEKPNKTILRRTLFLMAVCGVLAFFVLAFKLYQVQIVGHDYYEKQAVEQQTRESTVTAARGTIFDTNGKVLAMSASVESVFISPYETDLYAEDKDLIATNLSQILGVSSDSILEKMKDTKSQYKTIKKKIEKDVADKVRQFIKDNKLKSVHLEPDSKDITRTVVWPAMSSVSSEQTITVWTESKRYTTAIWKVPTGASSGLKMPRAPICSCRILRRFTTPRTATM